MFDLENLNKDSTPNPKTLNQLIGFQAAQFVIWTAVLIKIHRSDTTQMPFLYYLTGLFLLQSAVFVVVGIVENYVEGYDKTSDRYHRSRLTILILASFGDYLYV